MKKPSSLFFVLILSLVFFGCEKKDSSPEIESKTPNQVEKSTISSNDYKLIREELAKVLQIDPKAATMIINQQTEKYIRGNVSYNEKDSSFLAAKENDKWIIVYDGAGKMRCDEVKKYDFPDEMIEDCQ